MFLDTLTKYERRVLEAIASTIIPNPCGPFTKSVTDIGIAGRVNEHLNYLSLDTRLTYRLFLLFMELGGLFYKLRLKLFTQMGFKQRTEYLRAWHRSWWSPKRLIARYIEAIISMNYYSVPEVAAECGYTPNFKPAQDVDGLLGEGLILGPLEESLEVEAEVCVIGSGAGGAAVAATMAEHGHSVILLEEGGKFTVNDYGRDLVSMVRLLYRNAGLMATYGWPNILVPLGCCLGGTTVINSGTCFRCPDHVLERWGFEFGLSSWGSDKMKKYFERVEDVIRVGESDSDALSRNTLIFKRGLEKLGLKGDKIPRNAEGCTGSGVCCFGCPTNAKKSVDLNYIPMAQKHGARIYTHCRAEKINHENGRAGEVVASFVDPVTRKKVGRLTVKAKVVFISCGTLHTPLILKASKLPDHAHVIGRNLTLHPATKVIALFDEEVRGWDGIPQGYYMDALAAEGITLEQIFTPPAFLAPNLMLFGYAHSEAMGAYNKLAAFGMIISDTSRGRVFKVSGHYPAVWYSVNRYDLPKYLRGIAYLSEIFFAAGAKKVFPSIHGLPVITREEGIRKIYEARIKPKDLDLQAFHPLGTCRMGADPRTSACDPNGRLYGMDNVFVADGSIFPTSLGVNPQVTIMAAAHKIADHVHYEVL